MRSVSVTALALLAGALFAGCHRRPPAGAAQTPKRSPAAGKTARAGATGTGGHTVYTWYDAEGLPHTVADRAAIPAPFRSRVVVSHLGGHRDPLSEEVTVADLRGHAPRYAKVDLADLATGSPAMSGKALLAHDHGVTIYGTSWCHFCKAARRWLEAHHVAFADKDIEADPVAAAELKAKLKAAGIPFGGVPVVDVRGRIIVGFDPTAFAKALRATRARSSPPKAHG